MNWRQRIAVLLGISTFGTALPSAGVRIDDPKVEAVRRAVGGQLAPLPVTQTRWHLADLEEAERMADMGDLSKAARLMRAARKDGTFAGVLSTRTGGLVRLQKKFRGDAEIVAALEVGHESVRSVFDEMFPPSELAALAADGILLGVGVAELVPVPGRDYPVLVRLEPEFLVYRWNENRWYYQTIVGLMPIEPGQGRWVLFTPGGRVAPWQAGLWRAVGQAWIDKQHARLHKSNWEGKLANPARVAVSPNGASEKQKQSWWRAVMAWGVNTVFGVTPGYDVKLLESNGRGWECFNETIKQADRDMVIAVAGSTVLVDGGTGFANADVHQAIRADLIKDTAEALAYCLNTQGIPPWVVARFGEDAIERSAIVEWDVTPPADRAKDATAMQQAAAALTALRTAVQGTELEGKVDAAAFLVKFGVPIKGDTNGDGKPEDAGGEEDDDDLADVVPIFDEDDEPLELEEEAA